MALIKCKECGKEISDEINYCLHCGAKVNNFLNNEENNKSKINNIYIWTVILLPIISCILLWIIEYFTNSFLISVFTIIIFNVVLEIAFILKDYKILNACKIDTSIMGTIKATRINIPKYIFQRTKILKESIFKFIIWLLGFIFFIFVIVLEFNPLYSYNKYIKEVKEGRLYLCNNYTVEELINNYMDNPKWKSGKTKDGNIAVNISGKITYLDKPAKALIQFYIKDKEFEFNAFEIDGIPKTEILFYSFIESMCNSAEEETNKNAIVTFNNGLKIEEDEFYNEIKKSSKSAIEVLISKIDKVIYENELPNEIENAKDYSNEYIETIKNAYNSKDEYLKIIKIYGYKDEEDLKEAIYINYLQNQAINTYIENSITTNELKDYYDNNVYPDITLSHILTSSQEEAESIIAELNQIKENGEDIIKGFERIAKEKSEDTATKDKGGSLGVINNETLSSNYDEILIEARKINDGEYSSKIIKTELGYHIILKITTGTKKSYNDSISSIKKAIVEQKRNNNSYLTFEAVEYYHNKYNPEILDNELNNEYLKYFEELKEAYQNQ